MRAFKTKEFARFARRESIDDKDLRHAISRAERGLIDADLGGHVVKQRVGRRGAYRTVVVYRKGSRALFVLGFAKSDMEDIDDDDLDRLKAFAGQVLSWGDEQVKRLLDSKEWQEIV